MANLVHISNKAPQSEPLIRVYADKCTLNRYAVELMHLTDGCKVDLLKDADEEMAGRDRIYIGKSSGPLGFRVISRGRTCRIFSSEFRKILNEHLQGPGVYRISPEWPEEMNGMVYYNIFFRRYD